MSIISSNRPVMDFLDRIVRHYLRESQQGLGAAILGGILLIAVLLLFNFAQPASLLRGLTIPFLVIGLVMGLGGGVDGYRARRAVSERSGLFKENRKVFFDQETVTVEKVHRSWRRVFIIWSVVSVAGIVLFFSARRSYGIGVAIGLILGSIAGHIEEVISRSFNERYYQQVMNEARKAGVWGSGDEKSENR